MPLQGTSDGAMGVVEDLLQAGSRPRLLLKLMRVCRRLNAVIL
jgi:hypothetical protein